MKKHSFNLFFIIKLKFLQQLQNYINNGLAVIDWLIVVNMYLYWLHLIVWTQVWNKWLSKYIYDTDSFVYFLLRSSLIVWRKFSFSFVSTWSRACWSSISLSLSRWSAASRVLPYKSVSLVLPCCQQMAEYQVGKYQVMTRLDSMNLQKNPPWKKCDCEKIELPSLFRPVHIAASRMSFSCTSFIASVSFLFHWISFSCHQFNHLGQEPISFLELFICSRPVNLYKITKYTHWSLHEF